MPHAGRGEGFLFKGGSASCQILQAWSSRDNAWSSRGKAFEQNWKKWFGRWTVVFLIGRLFNAGWKQQVEVDYNKCKQLVYRHISTFSGTATAVYQCILPCWHGRGGFLIQVATWQRQEVSTLRTTTITTFQASPRGELILKLSDPCDMSLYIQSFESRGSRASSV